MVCQNITSLVLWVLTATRSVSSGSEAGARRSEGSSEVCRVHKVLHRGEAAAVLRLHPLQVQGNHSDAVVYCVYSVSEYSAHI